MKLIGRLVCAYKGHKRGRLIEVDEARATRTTECPRCGRRIERKAKRAEANG